MNEWDLFTLYLILIGLILSGRECVFVARKHKVCPVPSTVPINSSRGGSSLCDEFLVLQLFSFNDVIVHVPFDYVYSLLNYLLLKHISPCHSGTF